MLSETREQALDRMEEEARELGANAIIAVRFTTSEMMAGAAELLAYGTAVVVEPIAGVFIVRDVLGSSFLARALYFPLRPFLRSDAEGLVGPFAERRVLSEDVLDALFLASGGIPALLTYGLQELWKLEHEATADDVTAVYRIFERKYREYLRDLLSALTDPRLSDAPLRVWERIREGWHRNKFPFFRGLNLAQGVSPGTGRGTGSGARTAAQ